MYSFFTLARYAEGFVECLKRFIDTYEDEGKAHFNAAVTESELKLGVNPLGDNAPYIDCTVKDGALWILFQHTSLGSNQSYIYDAILAAVEAAPREGLSLRAKHSIAESWEENIDGLKKQLAAVTGISDSDLTLEPNFEENYKVLKSGKSDDGWEESFGRASFDYFENFKDNLIRQGFQGDDMLQEGLQDSLTSKKILLQVVSKIEASYNEVILKDGSACIQVCFCHFLRRFPGLKLFCRLLRTTGGQMYRRLERVSSICCNVFVLLVFCTNSCLPFID